MHRIYIFVHIVKALHFGAKKNYMYKRRIIITIIIITGTMQANKYECMNYCTHVYNYIIIAGIFRGYKKIFFMCSQISHEY